MIEVRNLTKKYFDETVVDDLTLGIEKGKVFGFLGQNGAGKTTAMKMMVGIIVPDGGSVAVGGVSIKEVSMRQRIGFMPESPYFYDRLTGLEFMKFCGELFGKKAANSEREYLKIMEKVDIYEARDRAIATYSKGMKQRLGFAQALVNDPEYIFLDEPLDGLDPLGRKEIKEVVKELKKEGKTVFFNSHILFDTEEICDEIGIINYGKLLYAGKVRNFCAGRSLEERFVELVRAHLVKQK